MSFSCQKSIQLFQSSFNTIRSVETTLNVSVFMTQIIYVFVNPIIIVSSVSCTIRHLINVTRVWREEIVFKMIQMIRTTSFVFVLRVIKEIDVNSAFKHLVSLSIHLSITRKQ